MEMDLAHGTQFADPPTLKSLALALLCVYVRALLCNHIKNPPAMRETRVRSWGEGKGYPLQYSGVQNSMDCIIHGVAKSRTLLSDFHFHSLATANRDLLLKGHIWGL